MRCFVCSGVCEKEVMHGGYTYWRCSACFTSQVLPQPSPDELQDYYDRFHLDEQVGGVYDEVEERMKADFPAKVKMVFKYANIKSPRLLDVGCGKGFFLKAAIDANINAEGIDYSRSGVDFAVRKLGVKATAGTIEEHQDEWCDAFDVVTFWATIEHLRDPEAVINAIGKCLKPGGILFCDTGLGNVYWEKFLLGHNQWYDAPQHLFVFSEQGLVRLLEKCGFNVMHVDRNYDRTFTRKIIRWVRHALVCVMGRIFLGQLMGKRGIKKMKEEAKWPVGRLISVVAQKKT